MDAPTEALSLAVKEDDTQRNQLDFVIGNLVLYLNELYHVLPCTEGLNFTKHMVQLGTALKVCNAQNCAYG